MLYCNVFILIYSPQLSVSITHLLLYVAHFSNIAQKIFYLGLMNAQSDEIVTSSFPFFMYPYFCLSSSPWAIPNTIPQRESAFTVLLAIVHCGYIGAYTGD